MSRTYRQMHRHAQLAARERRRARLFTQAQRAAFMRAALTILRKLFTGSAGPRAGAGKAGW